MNTLTNQTLYCCEYCMKRFFSPESAERHENYCKDKEKVMAHIIRWYLFQSVKGIANDLGLEEVTIHSLIAHLKLPKREGIA